MDCEHKEIVLANAIGKKLDTGTGGYAVDFLVRCNDCDEEFFRVSEYGRDIVNLSKH
ncbi:hypothetical protein [Lysinibacillus fusiformis]|uniref:hypothetical protein n=1 Tax=Lysinibacillus fusiformis TaxID=28031 RepID=UPI001EF4D0C2|nr:hypothetical protein [Lysinibacillus fusiformis]MCG7435544.1 hypothetical protein [Lysinibacillus fusiformis]